MGAPLLIVAGIPLAVARRHKDFRPSLGGWDLRIITSRENMADLHSCWDSVQTTADSASPSGAHIAAYHVRDSDRPSFNKGVFARHRLVWLNNTTLREFGTAAWVRLVGAIAEYESRWRRSLRPLDVRHPLILPESGFVPIERVRDSWKRAASVTSSHDDLARVASMLQDFAISHYRSGVWRDVRQLVFDPGGARHGIVKTPTRWKFTYLIPENFHFDVKHESGRRFALRDASGRSHYFEQYTNVDCHGTLRGGH
jgi:hypothetical protein